MERYYRAVEPRTPHIGTILETVQGLRCGSVPRKMTVLHAHPLIAKKNAMPGTPEALLRAVSIAVLHFVLNALGQLLNFLRLLDHIQGEDVDAGLVHLLLE